MILWLAYVFFMLVSTPLFNSEAYRNQMKDPEVKSFSSDVQAIDLEQIPIVDQQLAYKLADKKLGENPSLGSQVQLGEPTIQQVNGKLVWVVPLHHSGFFKWLSNMDGAKAVSYTHLPRIIMSFFLTLPIIWNGLPIFLLKTKF